jgi:hypothetical protein
LTAIQNQRAKVTPLMMSTAITNRAIHPPIHLQFGFAEPKERALPGRRFLPHCTRTLTLHDGATRQG